MKFSLLAVIASIVFIIIGCGALVNPKSPVLGGYEYTHQPAYQGAAKKIVPIWVDKNFSAIDQVNIKNAIDSWNYALNGYIKLEIVDLQFDMEVDKILQQVKQGGWLFMKINSDSLLVPSSRPGYHVIGFTERVGGHHLYLVRDRLGDVDIYGVTLHEIGHLLGSDHVGKRLMYPHYTRAMYQCIDWETIVEVSKYQELDVSKLNFCIDKDTSDGNVRIDTPHGGYTLTF